MRQASTRNNYLTCHYFGCQNNGCFTRLLIVAKMSVWYLLYTFSSCWEEVYNLRFSHCFCILNHGDWQLWMSNPSGRGTSLVAHQSDTSWLSGASWLTSGRGDLYSKFEFCLQLIDQSQMREVFRKARSLFVLTQVDKSNVLLHCFLRMSFLFIPLFFYLLN